MFHFASAASARLVRFLHSSQFALVVIAALLVNATAATKAQQPAATGEGPAGFIQVTAVTVKPAGVLDFEEYAKKAVAATAKVGGRPVQAYQPMYGNPNVYYFVVSLTAAKELDSVPTVPQALMKTYGEAEGARLLRAGRAVIDGIVVERHNTVRRISTNLRPGGKPSRYYQVRRTA
jgi:hypothetical protein